MDNTYCVYVVQGLETCRPAYIYAAEQPPVTFQEAVDCARNVEAGNVTGHTVRSVGFSLPATPHGKQIPKKGIVDANPLLLIAPTRGYTLLPISLRAAWTAPRLRTFTPFKFNSAKPVLGGNPAVTPCSRRETSKTGKKANQDKSAANTQGEGSCC